MVARLPEDPDDFRLSLTEHLEELRTRIIRVLLFLGVAWVAGWYIEPVLYNFLRLKMEHAMATSGHKTNYLEVFRHALDPFMLKFKLSFLIGLVSTAPFATLQLWGFIKPALKPAERKPVQMAAPASVILFGIGVFFSYLILPNVVIWFVSYMDDFPEAALHQDPGTLILFAVKMFLAFGLGFQLPLIVFVLGKVGILTPDMLIKNWRFCTAALFTGTAIITPSNDALSMLMMAIPLSILFAGAVLLLKITQPKKAITTSEITYLPPDSGDNEPHV